jgi:hypothetical protein
MPCSGGSPVADAPSALSGRSVVTMIRLLIALLVVWVVLAILGFVIKGLFWLAIVGIVLFLVTGGFAAVRGRTSAR